MGEWVGLGQMTNLIKLELIDIIRFCLKIYDLWRHPHLWVDGWLNGLAHVGRFFVPFARVGSGDPVRVLCLLHNEYTGYN